MRWSKRFRPFQKYKLFLIIEFDCVLVWWKFMVQFYMIRSWDMGISLNGLLIISERL